MIPLLTPLKSRWTVPLNTSRRWKLRLPLAGTVPVLAPASGGCYLRSIHRLNFELQNCERQKCKRQNFERQNFEGPTLERRNFELLNLKRPSFEGLSLEKDSTLND